MPFARLLASEQLFGEKGMGECEVEEKKETTGQVEGPLRRKKKKKPGEGEEAGA